MKELDGSVAIVTGGAGNLGRACANALAESGAKVVVADVDEAGAKECADGIAAGGIAMAVHVDLSDEASIAALVETTVSAFGRLDILHNNAAATTLARSRDLGVADMDLEVWDLSMRINLRGTMLASKSAIPHMRPVPLRRNTGSMEYVATRCAQVSSPVMTRAGLAQLSFRKRSLNKTSSRA
jgi:NAD(P)-dependent dehydrogenase (short-subunit alcohol dehydrogenase family)